MSLTRPRNYPNPPGPPGERIAMCAYCSMNYYRSTMIRDAANQLACTDGNCHTGATALELERENAAGAAVVVTHPRPGGDW